MRNGVVGNLCPVFVLRSNMCPPPGWLRPQPGLLDGSFSVDTEDGRRFFQENRRFPTSSCSFLRFSRFVDPDFTCWSVHAIPVSLVRYPSLVVLERAGHSVASVVTATNPLPISIGLTVTCRVGTCVHHPGYCQDWNLRKPVTLAGHCVTTTLESRGPLLGRRQNFHNNVPAGFAAANG